MTQSEFKTWMRTTDASRNCWTVDEVSLHNRHEYLMYRGGANGSYITISTSGLLSLGAYTDAVPHIGEAFFTQTFSKQFPSQELALQRVIEVSGLNFLIDFIGSR